MILCKFSPQMQCIQRAAPENVHVSFYRLSLFCFALLLIFPIRPCDPSPCAQCATFSIFRRRFDPPHVTSRQVTLHRCIFRYRSKLYRFSDRGMQLMRLHITSIQLSLLHYDNRGKWLPLHRCLPFLPTCPGGRCWLSGSIDVCTSLCCAPLGDLIYLFVDTAVLSPVSNSRVSGFPGSLKLDLH
jgi:hypothetical protein